MLFPKICVLFWVCSKSEAIRGTCKTPVLQVQPYKNACFAAQRAKNCKASAKLTEFCKRLIRQLNYMVSPRSTGTIAPLITGFSSTERAAAATSAGKRGFPAGLLSRLYRNCSSAQYSVSVRPGQITLQVTPRPPAAFATDLAITPKAVFAAE